jgi:hypothetical protein
MDKNGYLKKAKRIFKSAKKEYESAKITRNELKARQSAEKGYLCLLATVNALLTKSGIKEEKLPKNERGRTYFLQKYADREFRKSYDAIRHFLHIDTFHEGIIEYKKLKERFEDLENLLMKVELHFEERKKYGK